MSDFLFLSKEIREESDVLFSSHVFVFVVFAFKVKLTLFYFSLQV